MKCEDCGKREANIKFSNEPFLAMSHGWGIINICRQCLIKRVERHIKDCMKQLKEEKAKLKNENMEQPNRRRKAKDKR